MCDGSKKKLADLVIGDSVVSYSRGNSYAYGGSAPSSCQLVSIFSHTDQENLYALNTVAYTKLDDNSAGSATASPNHAILVVNVPSGTSLTATFSDFPYDV